MVFAWLLQTGLKMLQFKQATRSHILIDEPAHAKGFSLHCCQSMVSAEWTPLGQWQHSKADSWRKAS